MQQTRWTKKASSSFCGEDSTMEATTMSTGNASIPEQLRYLHTMNMLHWLTDLELVDWLPFITQLVVWITSQLVNYEILLSFEPKSVVQLLLLSFLSPQSIHSSPPPSPSFSLPSSLPPHTYSAGTLLPVFLHISQCSLNVTDSTFQVMLSQDLQEQMKTL